MISYKSDLMPILLAWPWEHGKSSIMWGVSMPLCANDIVEPGKVSLPTFVSEQLGWTPGLERRPHGLGRERMKCVLAEVAVVRGQFSPLLLSALRGVALRW